jgi:peptidoglycan/LPS O-acetylase OafA/YrhL
MRERQATGRIRVGNFYARRGLRLLPALIVVVTSTAVGTAWFAGGRRALEAWGSAALVLLYVGNLAMIRGRDLGQLAHTWSLGMEEQFYLVWPAVLAGLCRLRRVVAATLSVVAIGTVVAFRTYLIYRPAPTPSDLVLAVRRLSFSLDTRGEPVLMGCLVGLLAAWGVLRFLGPQVWAMLGWLGVAVLAALLSLAPWPIAQMYGVTASAGLATSFIIIAALRSGVLQGGLSWWPLTATGRISYGLYLWHYGLFHLCGALTSPEGPAAPFPRALLAWGLTFAVAGASYVWVELPFLKLKERF